MVFLSAARLPKFSSVNRLTPFVASIANQGVHYRLFRARILLRRTFAAGGAGVKYCRTPPGVNIRMTTKDANAATSLELHFLIDRHLAARRVGQTEQAAVYARAAEGLIAASLPEHAEAISSVASRKGDGRLIGRALALKLTSVSAAAVNVIWLIRGARRPAINALAEAFRDDVVFSETIRMLCARALPAAIPIGEHVRSPPTEIAAPYRR